MIGGHGHVVPRADGAKARCGGPALCSCCARELAVEYSSLEDLGRREAIRAEEWARRYHDTRERLTWRSAPARTPWSAVAEHERQLLVAVFAGLFDRSNQ